MVPTSEPTTHRRRILRKEIPYLPYPMLPPTPFNTQQCRVGRPWKHTRPCLSPLCVVSGELACPYRWVGMGNRMRAENQKLHSQRVESGNR
jgi:hypothetical protein